MKIKKNYGALSGLFRPMSQADIDDTWRQLDIELKHENAHGVYVLMMGLLSDMARELRESVVPLPPETPAAAILRRDNRKAGEGVRYK